jgi:acyl carrier protein
MDKLIDPFDLVAKALNTKKETLTIDSRMHEHPNWDSIDNVEIIVEIELNYGITIDDAMKYNNIKAIVELYEKLKEKKS